MLGYLRCCYVWLQYSTKKNENICFCCVVSLMGEWIVKSFDGVAVLFLVSLGLRLMCGTSLVPRSTWAVGIFLVFSPLLCNRDFFLLYGLYLLMEFAWFLDYSYVELVLRLHSQFVRCYVL